MLTLFVGLCLRVLCDVGGLSFGFLDVCCVV